MFFFFHLFTKDESKQSHNAQLQNREPMKLVATQCKKLGVIEQEWPTISSEAKADCLTAVSPCSDWRSQTFTEVTVAIDARLKKIQTWLCWQALTCWFTQSWDSLLFGFFHFQDVSSTSVAVPHPDSP